jgi:hypothetical protein
MYKILEKLMQRVPAVLSVNKEKSILASSILRLLVALLFCAAMFGRPAAAQSTQQFVGNVADTSHAVIAGATVTIHNENTQENLEVKTTGAGDYTVTYLKPGLYTVTVSKEGFETVTKTHNTLDIDKTEKVDFILPVGSVTETVTVSDAGAQIELSKADRGEIIGAERVQEMPTDGRNILELFELSPGTVNLHSPNSTRPQDNVGTDLHANGLDSSSPVQENLDGVMNDMPSSSGFDMGYTPPPDSVAEFKVVLNPYDASYGRAGGGAVDISLKSGTNKIHGDLYEYARRPWLDANNYTNDYNHIITPGTPVVKPAHKRDQFGLEADGPVYIPHLYDGRDKTFFTIQWEQAYENLPNTSPNVSSIPDPNWLTGNFGPIGTPGCTPIGTPTCDPGAEYYNATTLSVQPLTIYDPLQYVAGSTTQHLAFPGNIIPLHCTPTPPNTQCSSLNPVGLALAQYYAGIPTNQNLGTAAAPFLPGVAPFQNNLVNLGVENDISRNGLIKLEQNFGPRDRGSIRWGGFERYDTENANGIPVSNPATQAFHQIQPKDQTYAIDEIHTFSPNFILDNKAVLLNSKLGLLNGTHGNFLPGLGFSQHFISAQENITQQFPQITGTGYIDLGSGGNTGNWTIAHNLAYQPSITLIHGRHTLRAGFDMRLNQVGQPGTTFNNAFTASNQYTQQFYNNNKQGGDPTNYTSGNGIASLLIGDLSAPTANSGITLKYSVSPFYSQHYYSVWAQDDWKATQKLTLNFGVRYDLLEAPVERHNQLNYAFDTTDVNTQINSQVQAQHPSLYCSVTPATAPGTCLGGAITGGIRFAGVNGAPRGAYATNLLNIQPRFGAAYAFSSRTSLRAGFGEMFITDVSNDSSNGFSASSTYVSSSNNGTPNGNFEPLGNLGDPYAFSATSANPTGTVQPLGSSLGLATTPGSSVNFTNPNYKIPALWEYSVSLEQLLSREDVLDISYSGSREYNGSGSININPPSAAYNAQCDYDRNGDPTSHNLCDGTGAGQGQVANPFLGNTFFSGSYSTGSTISRSALSRPFPAFTDITESQANIIHTWYNSLQVAFSHNVSRVLSLHAAYTWSKAMTSGSQIDATNQIYARTIDSNDRPNVITFSTVFYVPVGRGKALLANTNRVVDAVVGGWEISPLYVYTAGVPWTPGGTNWIQLSPVGIKAHDIQPNATHPYVRLQGITPCAEYENTVNVKNSSGVNIPTIQLAPSPSYTEFGCTAPALIQVNSYAVAHNVVYWGARQGATHEFDASLSKNFAVSERVRFQARLDVFNLLNHPNWNGQYTTSPTSTYFGALRKGPSGPGTPPRDMQISGKITF